jgi:hypothetical protein
MVDSSFERSAGSCTPEVQKRIRIQGVIEPRAKEIFLNNHVVIQWQRKKPLDSHDN